MKGIARLFRYLRPYSWNISGFFLLTIFSIAFSIVSLTMAIPFLQILFDRVTPPAVRPEFSLRIDTLMDILYYNMGQTMSSYSKTTMLGLICGGVIVLFFLKNMTSYLGLHMLAPMRTGVIYELRKRMYHKITSLPLSYFTNQRKGDVLTRMSSDVVEIEWSIMNSIISSLRDPLLIIGYLVVMFVFSPQLSLFALVLLPVSALIIGRVGRSLKKASFSGQKILSDLMVIIEETLGGIRIVKAFHAEDQLRRKFDDQNDKFKKLGNSVFRKRSMSSPMSEFLGSIVIATVMWFGGNIVLTKQLDPEVFITYIAMFSQIISPAKAFSASWYNLQKGLASLDRIEEILSTEVKLTEKDDPIRKLSFEHSIELRNVHFHYVQTPVLEDVNLVIPKGKTIALVGQSGAGKSTLADLIPRFYDVVSGEIRIDDTNVKDIKVEDMRNLMGIVPQQPILFNDTIAANIAFGDPAPNRERIHEAARMANAYDFVMEMEDGFDSNVGEQGTKLSGGQRQRIAIARALYKNPPILILDEATSSLDTESEKLVQDAINRLMQNRTSLVIAHRLSTIQHADEIIVLEKGKIAERGKHAELVQKDGIYRRLYELNTF